MSLWLILALFNYELSNAELGVRGREFADCKGQPCVSEVKNVCVMEFVSRDGWSSNRTTQLLALVMSEVLRLLGQTRKYEKLYLKQNTVTIKCRLNW